MDPLVSVLVPTYNRSACCAVRSVRCLAQTYANIELLISDNHSTDDTSAVVAEFSNRDPRFRPIPSPPPDTPGDAQYSTCAGRRAGQIRRHAGRRRFFSRLSLSRIGRAEFLNRERLGLLVTDCVIGRPRREATHLAIGPVTPGREFFFGFWRGPYHVPVISNLVRFGIGAALRTVERSESAVCRRRTVAEDDDAHRRGLLPLSGRLLPFSRPEYRVDGVAGDAQGEHSLHRQCGPVRGRDVRRGDGAANGKSRCWSNTGGP